VTWTFGITFLFWFVMRRFVIRTNGVMPNWVHSAQTGNIDKVLSNITGLKALLLLNSSAFRHRMSA